MIDFRVGMEVRVVKDLRCTMVETFFGLNENMLLLEGKRCVVGKIGEIRTMYGKTSRRIKIKDNRFSWTEDCFEQIKTNKGMIFKKKGDK